MKFLPIGLLLLLLTIRISWAQVTVRSVEPSISKPDAKGHGVVSFNTSQLLMDNHTIHPKYLADEGTLTIKKSGKEAKGNAGLIQVFPWTSTVKLKEIGFLINFGQPDYISVQEFRLMLYELQNATELKASRAVASFSVIIPQKAVQRGKYLSFLFEESLQLEKGKRYAIHLYPTQQLVQEISFQLADTHFLGFSANTSGQKLAFIPGEKQRPDLNIYLVAE